MLWILIWDIVSVLVPMLMMRGLAIIIFYPPAEQLLPLVVTLGVGRSLERGREKVAKLPAEVFVCNVSSKPAPKALLRQSYFISGILVFTQLHFLPRDIVHASQRRFALRLLC